MKNGTVPEPLAPMRLIYQWEGFARTGAGSPEHRATLNLDEAAGALTYELTRSSADQNGIVIGLFHMALPNPELPKHVETALDATLSAPLANYPEMPGPGSLMTLDLARGEQHKRLSFRSSDAAELDRAKALTNLLRDLCNQTAKHPVAALRLTVVTEGDHFVATFENPGTEAVLVAEPRRLPASGGDTYARVEVGTLPLAVPGVTDPPIAWQGVLWATAPSHHVLPSELTIPPSGRVTVATASWKPYASKPGRLVARALWSSYGGTERTSGIYRIRGAVFSEVITVPSGR